MKTMDFLVSSLENIQISSDILTVVINSDENVDAVREELVNEKLLGFDCEGVDFGRPGKVCIVQLSTMTKCYLFDVLNEGIESSIVLFLKSLLESTDIVKVIHDCKMDSDALYHLCGIKICNCHDTQAWDKMIFNRSRGKSLNQTLQDYGCPVNDNRDTSVYQKNKAFWATRPLTRQMIDWASGDVSYLFELYDKQVALASDVQKMQCKIESERHESFLRDCIIHKASVKSMSRLIGSGELIYASSVVPGTHCQPRGSDVLYIYGFDDESIKLVLLRLDCYLKNSARK